MKCVSVKISYDDGDFSELSRQNGLSADDMHEFVDAKYKPAEPLIKDQKARKAVRAWAEANNRDSFMILNEHFNCCKIIGYTDGGNSGIDRIEFHTTIAGAAKDYHYTISELCGEDEE